MGLILIEDGFVQNCNFVEIHTFLINGPPRSSKITSLSAIKVLQG